MTVIALFAGAGCSSSSGSSTSGNVANGTLSLSYTTAAPYIGDTVTLTASLANSSLSSESITFVANPTTSLTFIGTKSCTITVTDTDTSGSCSVLASVDAAGTIAVTATSTDFPPTSTFFTSTGSNPSGDLTITATPSILGVGNQVTLTASLTNATISTENVTFSQDNGTLLTFSSTTCTITVTNGSGTCSVTATAGDTPGTATVYLSGTNFNPRAAQIKITPVAYVADSVSKSIFKCNMKDNGDIDNTSCATATWGGPYTYAPIGIVFSNGSVYVPTGNGITLGQLYICSLTTSNCTTPTTPIIVSAIAFNGSHLYYSSQGTTPGTGQIQYCDTDGNSCVTTPESAPAWSPITIAFASNGTTQIADVATGVNNVQTQTCRVAAGGEFTSCQNAFLDSSSFATFSPISLAFDQAISPKYVYIVGAISSQVGAIEVCNVSDSSITFGQLENCTDLTERIGPSPDILTSVSLYTAADSVTYAYITENNNNAIWKCPIDSSDGTFSANCTSADLDATWYPTTSTFSQ